MASGGTHPPFDPIEPIREVDRLLVREWLLLFGTALVALPALVLRVLEVTHTWDPHLGPEVMAIIFGLGIFAAATLLTWASEVAETEISAGLALVVLALIAVLPEYAVDLYFAWTAPDNPENAHLAVANMTGGNRLLVGLAWPVIFFIFWRTMKKNIMPIERSNAIGILFLGAATVYSFSIPVRGYLSLVDTAIMFSLFAGYLYIASRTPPEHDREFVGPAAAIGALPRTPRRLMVLGIFAYAALVIFAAAEPFAESLVETGEALGIDEFVLVQWVAPLASESPEFILAAMLAMRGRYDAGMTILISSKVNQWTLLIGSLPLAYAISGGSTAPLDFDTRQSEELLLTAAQSLFAVAILVSLSMSRWEAGALFGLFMAQFVIPHDTVFPGSDINVRVAFSVLYCVLAFAIFIRDVPIMRDFWAAAKESWQPRPAPGPAPPT
jgi:cation:H+ antiporter